MPSEKERTGERRLVATLTMRAGRQRLDDGQTHCFILVIDGKQEKKVKDIVYNVYVLLDCLTCNLLARNILSKLQTE
ncbi:hypothetical protein B9Z55_019367 [Caenorhabditis nigoni]|uniref:Uncharacterized protein n=1 Tax=Caenorhabditis nigoni TaxID=1611254 RepID=A0A2G5TIX7_9PELO|nr:hypothetical protein B9Z55_019367 [Caenorhabditis nigoni]